MGEGDTLTNAAIGALVTVIAGSVIPFGTVFGGGVAGYLQGGTREDGLKVGALAGVLALVPFLLLISLFYWLVFGVLVSGSSGALPAVFSGLFVLILLFLLVYVVGLSALGGYLGNYVRYDTDVEI